MCLRELLKGRMMAMKKVVMSSFYRFYPPILVHDFNLSLPITENVRCDFNTLVRELMDVAYIMKSELDDYGTYLGYLKYYINAPFDIFIDGDFEKNVETLKILKQRYWMVT